MANLKKIGCGFICFIGLMFLIIVINKVDERKPVNNLKQVVPYNKPKEQRLNNQNSYNKQLEDIRNRQQLEQLLRNIEKKIIVPRIVIKSIPHNVYDEGYDAGYNQGLEDGQNGHNHGYGYDDSNDYYDYNEEQYQEGYEDGYENGYYSGKSEYEEEYDDEEEEEEW